MNDLPSPRARAKIFSHSHTNQIAATTMETHFQGSRLSHRRSLKVIFSFMKWAHPQATQMEFLKH